MSSTSGRGQGGGIPSLRALLLDPQFVSLAIILGLAAGLLYYFGFQLLPFLVAFLIAYFLQGGVVLLIRWGWGRNLAVGVVYTVYLVAYVALLAGPVQIVARRAVQLARHIPGNAEQLRSQLPALPDPSFGLLPESLRADAINLVLEHIQQGLGVLVSGSLGVISQVTAWVMFAFLVPLLVFFFLKDSRELTRGLLRMLPQRRELAVRVWREMEDRMGKYIRGKIWEMLIVGGVSWLAFLVVGFEYPVVFGLFSGVSVLIPYIGMIAVAIPLALQGYLQWGLDMPLLWLMVAYAVIQFFDGNVLVPIMLSHAVKLHPVSILLAVVLFGSLWGLTGVLFAIPLATFVKILMETIFEHQERLMEERPPEPG